MARILAIDDEEDIRFLIKQGLSSHEVITAKDGSEGLEKAHLLLPDLVLLDVTMAEMSGSTNLEPVGP